MHTKKKVVVIGAGFAGVSAARTLIAEAKVPLEVVVLEASERVGGRACTAEIPGCGKIEMGATWFHGIHGNPLYEHAVQLGLMDRETSEHSDTSWGAMKYVRQGEPALLGETDAAIVTRARDMYGEAVEASTAAAVQGSSAVVGDSVRQAFAKAMEGMQSASARTKAIFTEAWGWREQLQRAMDGCDTTDDMSAAALAQYDEFEGPFLPLPCGYQVLAEKLAEGLPIKYGRVVEHVEWGSKVVTAHCKGGEQIQADAVIVTVSLGVLKAQHQHMFKPPLPDSLIGAIQRLGFGVVDKVIIDFGAASNASAQTPETGASHFGPAGGSNAEQSKALVSSVSHDSIDNDSLQPLKAKEALSYYLLWHRDAEDFQPKGSGKAARGTQAGRNPLHEIDSINKNLGTLKTRDSQENSSTKQGAGDKTPETHIVTSSQQSGGDIESTGRGLTTDGPASMEASSSGRHHVVPNWAHGAYSIRFAGSEMKESASDASLPQTKQCGVVWISGAAAQSMEDESDADLKECITAILHEFPALALPRQIKVYRSTWGSDPLFRGSYSYGSASTVDGECLALCEPQHAQTEASCDKEIKLLFAGEACHPTYFGCTHGAYLTGQSQARKLLSSWTGSML